MILVINKSKKEAEALASSFRYMGIPARGELPERAATEVSTFYRAIILFSPEKLPDEKESSLVYVRISVRFRHLR
jgi:hypothetical protein